jgi:AraC-like DNA-binding protein
LSARGQIGIPGQGKGGILVENGPAMTPGEAHVGNTWEQMQTDRDPIIYQASVGTGESEGPHPVAAGKTAPDPFGEVSEPERMRAVFERANLRFIPLDRECDAVQRSAKLRRSSIYAFSSSNRTLITGAIARDSVGCMLVTRNPDGGLYSGERLQPGDVLVAGPGAEFCSGGVRRASRTCLLPASEFEATMAALTGRGCPPLDGRVYRVPLGPEPSRQLESVLRHPWEARQEWLASGFEPQRIARFEDSLVDRVCTILSRAWIPPQEAPSRRADRYRLFARAAQLMRDPSLEPESLAELCMAVGVSEEVLRRVFQEFVGVPPMRYQRLLRMQRSREQLIACDPERDNVKSIAYRNRFYSLGRFAVEYKRMFGESPSQTLQQHAAR